MGRNSARASGEIECDIPFSLLTPLQIVVSEQEQLEVLLAEIEKVTQIVSRCKLYEIMYLDSVQVKETEDSARSAFVNLKAALVKLYTAILEVLAYVFNTFDKSWTKRGLSLTFNPEVNGDLANKLSSLDRDVINCAHICENVYSA